jgi:hypothetical protein
MEITVELITESRIVAAVKLDTSGEPPAHCITIDSHFVVPFLGPFLVNSCVVHIVNMDDREDLIRV